MVFAPMFKTPEEMEDKIQAYFESCYELQWVDEPARDEEGNKVYENDRLTYRPVQKRVQIKPITVTGLAVALGTSRKVVNEYQKKDAFAEIITKAKTICEEAVNQGMLDGSYNASGAIFNLKNNFNWHDKTEIEGLNAANKTLVIINIKNPEIKEPESVVIDVTGDEDSRCDIPSGVQRTI
jgi:hypothetical protein